MRKSKKTKEVKMPMPEDKTPAPIPLDELNFGCADTTEMWSDDDKTDVFLSPQELVDSVFDGAHRRELQDFFGDTEKGSA